MIRTSLWSVHVVETVWYQQQQQSCLQKLLNIPNNVPVRFFDTNHHRNETKMIRHTRSYYNNNMGFEPACGRCMLWKLCGINNNKEQAKMRQYQFSISLHKNEGSGHYCSK